ncbi:VirB9/CagX/TrbG, C-terminal [Burkholderiaceae bacterium]
MTTRGTWLMFVFVLLSGCMGPVGRPWPSEQPGGTNIPSGKLDFGWKLSGDRAIAPLQVFSDTSRTWLQWLPGQILPIILGATEQGEQVLTYLRQGPYTIIDGHWPALLFRSARQQARARRIEAPFASSSTTQQSVSQYQLGLQSPLSSQQHSSAHLQSNSHAASSSQQQSGLQQPSSSHQQSTQSSRPFFTVSHTDLHLRQALIRWAGLSGWRFEPEHWAVDVDIPLSASAKFSDDFVSSVQALLASTELSDRPLQPCFYSNQVLRIVPVAEPCDRTLGDGTPT